MQFSFENRQSNSPLVRAVWRTTSGQGGTFNSLAESHWGLVFTKQGDMTSAALLGPQTHARIAPVPEDAEFMGIVFKLGVVIPGLDVITFVDEAIELPGDGHHFWLGGKSWEIPTFENTDILVSKLARSGQLLYEPIIEKALAEATPEGMSLRTMQRQFLRTTGLTRNKVQQIERARSALLLLNEGAPVIDVITQAGYYDQPHLIRSFSHYLGYRPTESQGVTDWRALLNRTW